jgi:carbamoyltransferase
MTTILGISCFYHDAAAALLRDGEIVAAAQEERFSRHKHDPRFPRAAIKHCLAQAGITAAQLDHIAFYEKPLLTLDRLLLTYLTIAPAGLRSWLTAMPLWLGEKLQVAERIRKETGWDGEVLFTEHHEAHAASAFYPSPMEEAAILTVDGVGEWATATYGVGHGNDIELHAEMHFPHSLGLLYSAFTYFTGFRVNSGEYKLMGLAPYGEPRFVATILDHLVDLKEDGSLRLNMEHFNYLGGLTMTSRGFNRRFGGPPRLPEAQITQREMDLAASVQKVAELTLLRMARHLHRETGMRNLCLAGGVALNCVANGKILREGPFERIWIQPAAGDAGGALGAALSVWHRYLGRARPAPSGDDRQLGSYLGPAFSQAEIRIYLDEIGAPYTVLSPAECASRVAALIDEGKIVGYFSGRMEFGPRALGARSILGDPRRTDTQTVMNLKIKFRESFRPFAPAVLAEDTARYFELETESPYMLLVADVVASRREPPLPASGSSLLGRVRQRRSDIPAITHVDYSARVQTVDGRHHPEFASVLRAFRDLTGCSVLVNTSFNVRGEPIVCSPRDAYRCFMRTDMDALLLENCLLLKQEQPPWPEPRYGAAGQTLGAQTGHPDRTPVTPRETRRFGVVALLLFGSLAAAGFWRGAGVASWFLAGLATLGGALALAPARLSAFHRAWLAITRAVSRTVTLVCLALVHWLVVTPTALVMRLVGKGRLPLAPDRSAASYWVRRKETAQPRERFAKRY